MTAAPPLLDLGGRTYVVSGANTGLGRVTARALARQGAHVVLACRSAAKAADALAEIAADGRGTAEVAPLDLTSLAAVRASAAAIAALGRPIDGLVNNAGVGGQRGVTDDGFELHFGVNHLGPYLWTRLLVPALAPGARIVFVASNRHTLARGIDWDAVRRPTRTVVGMQEYGVSKLGNLLFQRELTRRSDPARLTTAAVNPGKVATDIMRRAPRVAQWIAGRFLMTAEEGARFVIDATARADLVAQTGRYLDQGRERAPSRWAQDDTLAAELWSRSAAWVGLPP